VVGINTAVAGDAQNIGFALAIDKALPIINTLKTGQAPEQPFLGLSTVTLTPAIQRQLGLAARCAPGRLPARATSHRPN
jgi:S1-C subfamily serine protease